MEETHLYQKIVAVIRGKVLDGTLKPGDRLPSIREMCDVWKCTPGTIQRAYRDLSAEGLLVSHAGSGTRVTESIPAGRSQLQETLRRANLVNRSESFLLENITAGYQVNEIQDAMGLALDRWRSTDKQRTNPAPGILRFSGSHDWVVNDLAYSYFGTIEKNIQLAVTYKGSLGGLLDLAAGEAEIAGCHLWDAESGEYNIPYIHHLFPGRKITVVSLCYRRQGLIVQAGNPQQIEGLKDLERSGVKFVNRQSGSGTRVWLDEMLNQLQVSTTKINGYTRECANHTEVARVIADGEADVGVGLETAARAFGLDFIFLNLERYDLVMLKSTSEENPLLDFIQWISSNDGLKFVEEHPGYESQCTGNIFYVG